MAERRSYEKHLTVEEFNDLLEYLDYVKDLEICQQGTVVRLAYKGTIYKCSLTGKVDDIINFGNIANILKSGQGVKELLNEENLRGKYGWRQTIDLRIAHKKHINWDYRDIGGFSYMKEELKSKWLKCYSYDINSAYSFAMMQPMPDTTQEPRMYDEVREGEIGFYKSGYATTEVGAFAEIIFRLVESAFIPYIHKYYDLKNQAPKGPERTKWKYFLNIPSGMLHKWNIFLRMAVLYYAAEYIKQFIDDDTVYCNVDSIVSLKPRTDLPLGDEIGQFKAEKVGMSFKYKNVGIYQWGAECHYKGIPGSAITDIDDTKDWKNNLPYLLKDRRIIKNEKN